MRYSAGNGTSTSMGLFIGSTRIKTLTCNATANWDTWANLTETVTLANGSNQIIFKSEASTNRVINLDYITIESTTSPSTYTVAASAGANGSINPGGSITVTSGASQQFSITANSGYRVSGVLVDGVSQGTISSYTFSNVTANHTISASFVANSTSYIITASAGANGNISPSGSVSVTAGSARQFSITPNSGYQIGVVTVDGTSQGAVSTYTFSNVNAPHTISATFVQQAGGVKYEMENATFAGGAKKNTDHSGYSGTGFVDGFYNSTTAQATVTVSASVAGSHTVTLRYSAGNGNSTNTGLYVNGTKIKNITCNRTTNWDTWSNLVETVTLNAGSNTIMFKVQSSSGSCINLDYITIVGNGSPASYQLRVASGIGGSTTAPSSSPITVNAGVATTISVTPNAGYKFDGWVVINGTAIIANAASATTTVTLGSGNAEIWAGFSVIIHRLTISAINGGTLITPATSPVNVNPGVATAISTSGGPDVYFGSWVVIGDQNATVADPTALSTTVTLAGDATVVAQWFRRTYNVIYNPNGNLTGSVPVDPNVYTYGNDFTVLPNSGKLRNGDASFRGWNNSPDGTGTWFSCAEVKTIDASYPNQHIMLYAIYSTILVMDNSGHGYRSVKVGNKYWMDNNLKTTTYNDGTSIPMVTDNNAWSDLRSPGCCYYNNTLSTQQFGALYNWYAVNTGKLAPEGWHVATNEEWNELLAYCESTYGPSYGCALKETWIYFWEVENCATNATEFRAAGNGWRNGGIFEFHKESASWWTATGYQNYAAYAWYLPNNGDFITMNTVGFTFGYGVRCVKD